MDDHLINGLLNRPDTPAPGDSTMLPSWPDGSGPAVEAAVIHHHRFAFYYWLKWTTAGWTRSLPADNTAPHLITIDRHDDVGVKADLVFDELAALASPLEDDGSSGWADRRRTVENNVAAYSFLGLPATNDGHIYPAQYLNAIGNVYVLYKEGSCQKHELVDRCGNLHLVEFFDAPEKLAEELQKLGSDRARYFDLDVDYFFDLGKEERHRTQVIVAESEIREFLDREKGLIPHAAHGANGLTFALEPTYCGGLDGCFRAMSIVADALFSGSLLGYPVTWK